MVEFENVALLFLISTAKSEQGQSKSARTSKECLVFPKWQTKC